MLAVVLWIMLPRGVSPERRPLPRLSDHLLIYSTPRLFAPGLGHGIYAFLFLALVTYLPAALDAPWLSPVLPVAGLTGSLLTGPLARRIVPGRLVWGGFLALVVSFALVWASGPLAPWVAILAMALSGIVAGAGFAAVPWLNPTNADRALANGALAQLGNVGTFGGTPVLAALGLAAAPSDGHRGRPFRRACHRAGPTARRSGTRNWPLPVGNGKKFALRSHISVGDSSRAPP